MADSHHKKRYGVEHAKLERKYFYGHLGFFFCVHIVFIFLFGLVPASELPSGSYLIHIKDWILTKDVGFYKSETGNSISGIWVTVIFVHAIWAFSYTFFPKKEPDKTKRKPKKTAVAQVSEDKEPIEKKTAKKKESEGRAWFYLFTSGLVEIYWAAGLKTNSFDLLTIVAIILSFNLLIKATKTIPIGTAYAVFTGIGTIGTILVDLMIFKEPVSVAKILLILLLALFIIGLKFTGDTRERSEQ